MDCGHQKYPLFMQTALHYGLPPQVSGFNSRPIYVGSVVHKMTMEQVSLYVLHFSPVTIIPPVLQTHSLTLHGYYIISAIESLDNKLKKLMTTEITQQLCVNFL